MPADGSYLETAPSPDLAGHVRCFWRREIGEREAGQPIRVLPDGCMDLLWMNEELLVAGPDTVAWQRRLPAGTTITGVRFQPGAAVTLLDLKPGELLNNRVDAAEFAGRWSGETAEQLYAAAGNEHVVFEDVLRERLRRARAIDPLVREAVRLALGDPAPVVSGIAQLLGISERQLHRRSCDALGYGMKQFMTIARLQRAMALQLPTIADIAASAGYADQAHLSREVRRMTGLTPTELIAG